MNVYHQRQPLYLIPALMVWSSMAVIGVWKHAASCHLLGWLVLDCGSAEALLERVVLFASWLKRAIAAAFSSLVDKAIHTCIALHVSLDTTSVLKRLETPRRLLRSHLIHHESKVVMWFGRFDVVWRGILLGCWLRRLKHTKCSDWCELSSKRALRHQKCV